METISRVRLSRKALGTHFQGFVRSLADRQPETRGTYTRALREFVRWHAHQRSFTCSVTEVERYKRYLSARRKLSSVSIATYMTAVRRFFEYLVARGFLKSNPARHVAGASRPSTHTRGLLTADDVKALLDTVDRTATRGARDYAILHLMVGCALSEIEMVRANVGDLHPSEHGVTLAVQGKGRVTKDATVILPQAARAALETYLAERMVTSPDEPLFVSAGNRTRGMRMTTRGIRDRVNHYLDRSGVRAGKAQRVTPYSLRHTAAVLMAATASSPDELRQRLRLGTVATAMLYYDRT